MSDTYIQFRADEEDKKEASSILNALGTNLSAVLKMTVKQIIIKRGIPFDVSLPVDNAVNSVAATMAMENMNLNVEQKNQLKVFHQMTQKDQEKDIGEVIQKYKELGNE